MSDPKQTFEEALDEYTDALMDACSEMGRRSNADVEEAAMRTTHQREVHEAFRRGQEAMRERAGEMADGLYESGETFSQLARTIRALPLAAPVIWREEEA